MTADIIEFHGETRLDIAPEKVLSAAIEAELESVIVIGRDKDGNLYLAASGGDVFETNWLLDIAKQEILKMGEE